MGRVVAVTDNGVAIDIGFKSEGLVPPEFPNIDELCPNDEVEVFLESVEMMVSCPSQAGGLCADLGKSSPPTTRATSCRGRSPAASRAAWSWT